MITFAIVASIVLVAVVVAIVLLIRNVDLTVNVKVW